MKYEPPMDPSKLIRRDEPLVIAHRGASTTAPENSLVSIEQAIVAGADLIEFDYFRADSNKMYVIHDAIFESKEVYQLSETEFRALDTSFPERHLDAYSRTSPPLIEEAIELILQGSVPLIEYKARPNQDKERSRSDADALIRLLEERGWLGRVVVQSFDYAFLVRCRKRVPKLQIGLLIGSPKYFDVLADVVEELQPQVIAWGRARMTPQRIAQIRAHTQAKIWVWYSGQDKKNDPGYALATLKIGVSGIITDHPGDTSALLDWYQRNR